MTEKWVLLVLQCWTLIAASALDCATPQDILKLQINCFMAQNFKLRPPNFFQNYTQQDQMRAMLELNTIEFSDLLCEEQGKFQKAIACFMDAVIKCHHDKTQDYFHEDKTVSQIIEDVCREKQNINFQCTQLKTFEFLRCGAPKKQEVLAPPDGKNMADIECKSYDARLTCQLGMFKDCGCYTLRAFRLLLMEMFHPPHCHKLTDIPVVECYHGPTASSDASTGGAQNSHLSAAVLLFSVVSIVFELFKF